MLDVVFDGDGGVGTVAAGAAETEVNGFAVNADEFEVAAVGLEGGAEFFEFGCDEVVHGWVPWGWVKGARASRPWLTK